MQERSEKSGEFTIVVNGEQGSYKSATSAFVEIVSQLLQGLDESEIEKVMQAKECSSFIATEPRTDVQSYFRAIRETGVTLGGKEILLGCSRSTPSKVSQVKKIMAVLKLSKGSIQWFKGGVDLLA